MPVQETISTAISIGGEDWRAYLVGRIVAEHWRTLAQQLGSEDAAQVGIAALWQRLKAATPDAIVADFEDEFSRLVGYAWRSAARALSRERSLAARHLRPDVTLAWSGSAADPIDVGVSVELRDALHRLWRDLRPTDRRDVLIALARAVSTLPVEGIRRSEVRRALVKDPAFVDVVYALFGEVDLSPLLRHGRRDEHWSLGTVGNGIVNGENTLRAAIGLAKRVPVTRSRAPRTRATHRDGG